MVRASRDQADNYPSPPGNGRGFLCCPKTTLGEPGFTGEHDRAGPELIADGLAEVCGGMSERTNAHGLESLGADFAGKQLAWEAGEIPRRCHRSARCCGAGCRRAVRARVGDGGDGAAGFCHQTFRRWQYQRRHSKADETHDPARVKDVEQLLTFRQRQIRQQRKHHGNRRIALPPRQQRGEVSTAAADRQTVITMIAAPRPPRRRRRRFALKKHRRIEQPPCWGFRSAWLGMELVNHAGGLTVSIPAIRKPKKVQSAWTPAAIVPSVELPGRLRHNTLDAGPGPGTHRFPIAA